LLYRRGREELPARHEEIENAEEEGLEFKFLAAPVEFYGDSKGWVKSMKCIEMALTEPDAKGRRGVKAVLGSEFNMDVDTVIIAIGQTPQPDHTAHNRRLTSDPKHGTITVNEVGKTSLDGVYAGGDVANMPQQQSSALWVQVKRAAKAIHEYLMNKK
jgi:glutamate synthase (NADPH/NADH) small chain